MEKVIEVLSDIETKANNIIQNAELYKKTMEKDNTSRINAMKKAIEESTQDKIDTLKERYNAEITQQTAKINLDCQEHIQALSDKIDKHLDSMADEIVHQIIEV